MQCLLDENKVIAFSGDKVYPRFGWCVILSGGTGSGKGFVINKQLPIDGKVMNVDHYNKLYFQGVTRKKLMTQGCMICQMVMMWQLSMAR